MSSNIFRVASNTLAKFPHPLPPYPGPHNLRAGQLGVELHTVVLRDDRQAPGGEGEAGAGHEAGALGTD